MDKTENQESPASPARVEAAADRIRELKPNVDVKYQKIVNIITDPHALIAAYQRIKSKFVKKEGMTNGRSSREEINFLSALIKDDSSTSRNNCAQGNTRETGKHPKIGRTRGDKTAYNDQRQRPDIINSHQGGL